MNEAQRLTGASNKLQLFFTAQGSNSSEKVGLKTYKSLAGIFFILPFLSAMTR